MADDYIKINEWLTPLSWLYGFGVEFRNQLFELGILKMRSFDVPVISVGNITVGGTGKTPHVEYLVRLLRDHMNVAVLSRGYKRKSHGYLLANENSTIRDLGDEPYQMKTKFPDINVAVDKNRCEGIERLTTDAATKDTDVILLDDAFQHRYVKPGINILLVDYHRLIIHDKLLPAGRLREPVSSKNRADIVIITKCPEDLNPIDYRVLMKSMNLYPYQSLFFSTLEYDKLKPVFGYATNETLESERLKDKNVLLLTGIASPQQMVNDIAAYTTSIETLHFADHHQFNTKDIRRVNEKFAAMGGDKLIVTTEKDAARLTEVTGLSDEVRNNLYTLPVKIKFMLDQGEMFNERIISYVRKNSRNSILVKEKNDNKPKDGNHSGNGSRTISFRNN